MKDYNIHTNSGAKCSVAQRLMVYFVYPCFPVQTICIRLYKRPEEMENPDLRCRPHTVLFCIYLIFFFLFFFRAKKFHQPINFKTNELEIGGQPVRNDEKQNSYRYGAPTKRYFDEKCNGIGSSIF